MPLQSSGAISISQIRNELNPVYGSSYSLRQLSAWASKSTPDAMSEFYGYNASPPSTFTFSYTNYVGENGTFEYRIGQGSYISTTISSTVSGIQITPSGASLQVTVYNFGFTGSEISYYIDGVFQGGQTSYSSYAEIFLASTITGVNYSFFANSGIP
jgi:hypothetical protein